MNFNTEYEKCRSVVDSYLSGCFVRTVPYKTLYDSMHYSLIAGGKRVRPILVMKFYEAVGGKSDAAVEVGAAIEMLHTYSLIHDDLPCMDDDDLRRGKPTNHVVFGEATAVLAGDALQSAAFETILNSSFSWETRAKAAYALACAAGQDGMCGGQILDMEGESRILSLEEIEQIHVKKTEALLEAACVIGVILGNGSDEQLEAARNYAKNIGLAFQIRDDLLDCISTTEQLGKNVGSDIANNKSTYVSLLGVEECQRIVEECTENAIKCIDGVIDNCAFLVALAKWLAGRMN